MEPASYKENVNPELLAKSYNSGIVFQNFGSLQQCISLTNIFY